jgi:hypothetical protein
MPADAFTPIEPSKIRELSHQVCGPPLVKIEKFSPAKHTNESTVTLGTQSGTVSDEASAVCLPDRNVACLVTDVKAFQKFWSFLEASVEESPVEKVFPSFTCR